MMRWLLLLLLLFPLSVRADQHQRIDHFEDYLQYEVFSPEKCKHPREGVACGFVSPLFTIFAERESPTSFYLTVKFRTSETKPLTIHQFLIEFTEEDGTVVTDMTPLYINFRDKRYNEEVPLLVRRWMLKIHKVFYPKFYFIPRGATHM